MDKHTFNEGLLKFLQQSPTPFHATQSMLAALESAGFELLREEDTWQLKAGRAYVVERNGSSIIAFTVGDGDPAEAGLQMVGAHTDSPCLKLKPNPVMRVAGALQFAVEVYGGALLAPWFDRDLSLAGRVDFRRKDGVLESALLNWRKPLATVPSLAIHLDREANQNRSINAQRELPPVLALLNDKTKEFSFDTFVSEALASQCDIHDVDKLMGHELYLYDTQAPSLLGLHDEFIASARLDNLLSCYVGLQGMLATQASGRQAGFSLLVCNDHEEVGSASACGAQGPFLKSVLSRLMSQLSTGGAETAEAMERMIRRSLFLSIDNAHGLHPNFADKHDGNHGPQLNRGPVIKINANQRYATSSRSEALFRELCDRVEVPVQSFVVRSDMGCGSTIGPITATSLGVDTIDIGVPTWGMHSIRELAGSEDGWLLATAVRDYFSR